LASLLVLGGGYIGAAVAELALAERDQVTIADNWYATKRGQLDTLEDRGARVETADIRDRSALRTLLAARPDRVYLLAAQASRPLSFSEPEYTEQTNLVGPRLVAEEMAGAEVGALVYASSLHVYGTEPGGEVGPDHPVGPQRDLAHLSKVYAELLLRMYAERHGFDLAVMRLGIVYGPSPVEHERAESQTVVDKFRRLAAAGDPLPIDDGGGATIGVAHISDVARILHSEPSRTGVFVANVAAESVTVSAVAALAEGRDSAGEAACTFPSPYRYDHRIADYFG
jgi:UDP-glucose 4-epimerase